MPLDEDCVAVQPCAAVRAVRLVDRCPDPGEPARDRVRARGRIVVRVAVNGHRAVAVFEPFAIAWLTSTMMEAIEEPRPGPGGAGVALRPPARCRRCRPSRRLTRGTGLAGVTLRARLTRSTGLASVTLRARLTRSTGVASVTLRARLTRSTSVAGVTLRARLTRSTSSPVSPFAPGSPGAPARQCHPSRQAHPEHQFAGVTLRARLTRSGPVSPCAPERRRNPERRCRR